MKVAILAGGLGTRLTEETETKPKPMVDIGGRPILWHIMKHYAHYGFARFVIALGYKGDSIKRFFLDYHSAHSDLTITTKNGNVRCNNGRHALDDWTIELVDTGLPTATGGRIKRLAPYLNDGTFMLTWGDGVSDINLTQLLKFHRSHGRLATVTAVRPPARFGRLELEGDQVVQFSEKPQIGEGWINGAFFVLEPAVFSYIEGDDTQWERQPLERLASEGQLMAYKHDSFWQCMDTVRDRKLLEQLWAQDKAPWNSWS